MVIQEKNIFIDKDLKSKEEVLNFIAKSAYSLGITSNKDALLEDLLKRENEFPTGIRDGFAIPHTKSANVKEASILYIKTNQELEWKTLDDSKVRYVFSLLAPQENEGNIHLKTLSKLATCLMEDDFTSEVKNSSDVNHLVKYITNKMKEE
ncbi:PTS system, fructose subfamily, IIA component domain protein [Clostridioides difficile CD160]|nr:PTS system, fructose subfamily, IIA component domain protein [Clostridioides difficile CD160]